jgi:hypothetical protein
VALHSRNPALTLYQRVRDGTESHPFGRPLFEYEYYSASKRTRRAEVFLLYRSAAGHAKANRKCLSNRIPALRVSTAVVPALSVSGLGVPPLSVSGLGVPALSVSGLGVPP